VDDKLQEIARRFERLTADLSNPEVITDRVRFQQVAKERSQLEPLVEAFLRRQAVAVLASPYMPGGATANVPPGRLLASVCANWLLTLCIGRRLHTLTGMVRAYDRVQFRKLLRRAPQGEFNSWAVAELLSEGLAVEEIPATLAWPPERREAAGRLSFGSLVRRAVGVVQSMRALAIARRLNALGRTGTLDLGQAVRRPFS